MKLEEITIERLDEAYRKTGTKPGRRFMEYAMELCPLAVLGRELGCHWSGILEGDGLFLHFANGFDGVEFYGISPAYELGRSIAEHYRAEGFDVGMTSRIGDAT